MVPVALAVICLVAASRGRGRLDPVGESSKPQNYVEKGIEHYEQNFRLQRIKWLTKEAQSLNLQLVPTQ
jgi:hypothetical protein